MLVLTPARSGAAGAADQRLRALGEEFVARRLAAAPHEAARLGRADEGRPLIPVTAATIAEERAWLRDLKARLDGVHRHTLGPERALERDLLEASVERRRIELDVLRPFERDPGAYRALVADAIESVLDRPGVPACLRARHAARRLLQVPEVLRAARILLREAPRELTESALEEYPSVLLFYRETVPALAAACRDARVQADLAQADTTAVRAVESFLGYLREDLLPAARGEPAIGPEALRRLLWTMLMDDVAPVETLRVHAWRSLERARAQFDSLAPVAEATGRGGAPDSLAAEARRGEALAGHFRRRLERVRGFLERRDLITLPAREALGVRPARPYPPARAAAVLRPAGPPPASDPRAVQAWLEVRPPASGDDAPARRTGCDADLAVIHEGLPGAYLRAVALRRFRSRLRQALQSEWRGEDWSQYCEQMMMDEGYAEGDAGCRVAAAARALLQAGRALVALEMHAGGWSADQARRVLQERCLLDPDLAAREVRVAAANPAVMGYTLGAQHLLELRDEVRRTLGVRFQVKVFNDAVLRYGASPSGMVRRGVRHELGVADGGGVAGETP